MYYGYVQGFPTAETPNGSISYDSIASGIIHTYTLSGKFLITINATKNKTYLDYTSKYNYPNLNEHILDTFYVHKNDNHTWKNLTAIYNFGCLNWRSFEQSFANARNLTTLPDSKLFLSKNNIKLDAELYNTLTNIRGAFLNCNNISYFEYGFILPETTLDFSECFKYCFQNETVTVKYPRFKNIFGTGFTNTLIPISGAEAFYNCTHMSGQVLAKRLWYSNMNNANWQCPSAFYGTDTSIQNYAYIPSAWGGGGKIPTIQFTIDFNLIESQIAKNNDSFQVISAAIALPIQRTSYINGSPHYYYIVDWGDGNISRKFVN